MNKNKKKIKEINMFKDLVEKFKDIKKYKYDKTPNDWGWALRPYKELAELSAPTNKQGQWKIISGMPGCGKTSLLISYYNRLIKEFNDDAVAVMAIGEREIEIEDDWASIVPSKHLYALSSEAGMPGDLVEKLYNIVEKIQDNINYKAVIVDSLSGIYNIISNYSYLQGSGLGAGGLNIQAPYFINNYIIKPLRIRFEAEYDKLTGCYDIISYTTDRIIISSLLYGEEMRDRKSLYETFKSLCDSEVKLDERLVKAGVFPAIDVKSSYSRRIDKFCSSKYLEVVNTIKEYSINEINEWLNTI